MRMSFESMMSIQSSYRLCPMLYPKGWFASSRNDFNIQPEHIAEAISYRKLDSHDLT